jgi:hypothetical protein
MSIDEKIINSAMKSIGSEFFKNSELPDFLYNIFRNGLMLIDVPENPNKTDLDLVFVKLFSVTGVEGAFEILGPEKVDLIKRIYDNYGTDVVHNINSLAMELFCEYHDYLSDSHPVKKYLQVKLASWKSIKDLDFVTPNKIDRDFLSVEEQRSKKIPQKIVRVFEALISDLESEDFYEELKEMDTAELAEEAKSRLLMGGITIIDIRYLNYISSGTGVSLSDILHLLMVVFFEAKKEHFRKMSEVCSRSRYLKDLLRETAEDWDSLGRRDSKFLFEAYKYKNEKDLIKLVDLYSRYLSDFDKFRNQFSKSFEERLFDSARENESSVSAFLDETPTFSLNEQFHEIRGVKFENDFSKVYFKDCKEPIKFTPSQAIILEILVTEYRKSNFRPKSKDVLRTVYLKKMQRYEESKKLANLEGRKFKTRKPKKPNQNFSIKLYFSQNEAKGGKHPAYGKGKFIVPVTTNEEGKYGDTWSLMLNFNWKP